MVEKESSETSTILERYIMKIIKYLILPLNSFKIRYLLIFH